MTIKNRRLTYLAAAMLVGLVSSGCGFERIQPALPNAFPNFSFEQLRAIQRDERLTPDERREAIRTAIDAPMTVEGDRLVEYLLAFTIP